MGANFTNLQPLVSTASVATVGADWSVNAVSIPLSGYVLLQTIPLNPNRVGINIQNLSANTIQVVFDDGTGANQSSFLVASGGTQPSAGGDWFYAVERGRCRVYSKSSTDAVSIREN